MLQRTRRMHAEQHRQRELEAEEREEEARLRLLGQLLEAGATVPARAPPRGARPGARRRCPPCARQLPLGGGMGSAALRCRWLRRAAGT